MHRDFNRCHGASKRRAEMTRGAYRAIATPDGRLIRKDGGEDGRYRKRKTRETPWYVRLSPEWFALLESMLHTPVNVLAGTAIPGCHSRADLVEAAFSAFLRNNHLSCNLAQTSEAAQLPPHNASIMNTPTAEVPLALPAPLNSNPSRE
jgi:hypothetical protein